MPRLPRIVLTALLCAAPWAPPSAAGAQPRVEAGPSSLVYPGLRDTFLGINRCSPGLLALLLGGRVRFDDPSGVACAHMAAADTDPSQLTVFGLNRGAGQIVYNPTSHSLAVYGGPGSGKGEFSLPQGIACLPDGTVAVADTGNDRVVFLEFRDGSLVWRRVLGSRGGGPGQFRRPEGVALDSQGRLYVADTGNNRVQAFDREGRFLEAFGGDPHADNSLIRPRALAVADADQPDAVRPESALFVLDLDGGRLQKFGLDGTFLGQATARDLGRAAVGFDSLALDYFDNVWVTDRLNDQIDKFDFHLQWLDSWGRPGRGRGTLDEPRGIAINRRYGQVVVLERESAQYLWIGADIEGLRVSGPVGPRGRLRVDYRLSSRSRVSARVEDTQGRTLAVLLADRLQDPGAQTLWWNGSLDGGGSVAPGTYALTLRASAVYSSGKNYQRQENLRFHMGDVSPARSR